MSDSSFLSDSLVDRFGRMHRSLRVSVTDRCNIRCFYCMPAGPLAFLPRQEVLTYEEIARVARVATSLGIQKFRITGGEPLVRSEVWRLVDRLVCIDGVEEVALTTNGLLLAEQATQLARAGLDRINISLDTLREEIFERIARHRGLYRVLDGIAAAQDAGFTKIRLNALSIRGLTEEDIVPLAAYAFERGLELRFIEFMPLDADESWKTERVLSGDAVRAVIEDTYGPMIPVTRQDPSQPAVDFEFADRPGRIGFINPVTAPFCGDCDRLRLTAEGQIRNCLFSTREWDLRSLLREGEIDDAELAAQFAAAVTEKKAGHVIDTPAFLRPERAMYQIGG
ncbi:MAG: GTP 3',8-cyclase MoaA [Planctomycetaceae bacterium]|nr:GTP 3',8-cyclase MoaA [Planctomycetaceae bacterium]